MKVLIVGGGITGLAAAWYIKKKNPDCHITLLEKSNRLGGSIQTHRENGLLFELGPRTFRLGASPKLLQLINDLGLDILISKTDSTRYLLYKGALRSSLFFLPMLLPHLFKEPFIKPTEKKDESIYDFAARRFSPKIANTLFDPLALGIYAGDIRRLSMRACFPTLFEWEQKQGSLLKGFLFSPKINPSLFKV